MSKVRQGHSVQGHKDCMSVNILKDFISEKFHVQLEDRDSGWRWWRWGYDQDGRHIHSICFIPADHNALRATCHPVETKVEKAILIVL